MSASERLIRKSTVLQNKKHPWVPLAPGTLREGVAPFLVLEVLP